MNITLLQLLPQSLLALLLKQHVVPLTRKLVNVSPTPKESREGYTPISTWLASLIHPQKKKKWDKIDHYPDLAQKIWNCRGVSIIPTMIGALGKKPEDMV